MGGFFVLVNVAEQNTRKILVLKFLRFYTLSQLLLSASDEGPFPSFLMPLNCLSVHFSALKNSPSMSRTLFALRLSLPTEHLSRPSTPTNSLTQ
jgi:hypothetical protein